MIATCSTDKTVTLWDTYNTTSGMLDSSRPPQVCGNKDMGVGKLYTVQFYPSAPWLLGCAGGGKELALWDMSSDGRVQKRFGTRVVTEEQRNNNNNNNDDNTNTAAAATTSTTTETELDPTVRQEEFQAMMGNDPSTNVPPTNETSQTPSKANQKKKDRHNNKKKKVHRARR